MDRLNQMRVFVTVVERQSFTAAANSLGMAKSTVSRQVSDLEARLGVRLLYRTTRVLHPTEVGQAYFDRCQGILQEIEEADAAVVEHGEGIRGTLRVASASIFATLHLLGPIQSFQEAHPNIRVDLRMDDQFVNLVEGGVDLAIRVVQAPSDSSLVARKLTSTTHHLVASPAFLQDHPIASLDDLARVPAVVREPPGAAWMLEGPAGNVRVDMDARLTCNQGEPVLRACRAGMGVALLPDFMTYRLVAAGHLVRVLPEWSGTTCGVYAIYPHRRLLSARVRAFIDTLAQAWLEPPWA